jgi:hypothetical protein
VPQRLEPPPSALASTPPIEHRLPAGWCCWRVYFRGGAHPDVADRLRRFGPTDARYDHHEPPMREQERGTFYAAATPATCLAEVFQDTLTIERERNQPWLVGYRLRREVRLLDLTGSWARRAGASLALNFGPRDRARAWSRAIYDAYPRIEGLYYPAPTDASDPAVLLYERAADSLRHRPVFHRALADDALLPIVLRIARRLGYAVV